MSINSREATFDELNVVVELNAIPIPIPKISTPPKMAMLAKLKIGDWKIEALGVLVGLLLEDLRLIFALLPSRQIRRSWLIFPDSLYCFDIVSMSQPQPAVSQTTTDH